MRPSIRRALLGLTTLALAACDRGPQDPEPGVALSLAEHRARTISDLHYAVSFAVPAARDSAVGIA